VTNSSVGEALLALQDCDSAIAKLQHQRTHSPDATAVADAERELAALAESLRVLQVEFTKAAEEHGAVDAELSACEKRLADLRGKLEHATGNSRDLMAMSEEVEHLSKQQSALEDRVLAAMDVLEGIADNHFCQLTSADVVRHRLVSEIVDAYARAADRPDTASRAPRRSARR
jgi:predicted  nucleic acid-binding Zn-ribbon protein